MGHQSGKTNDCYEARPIIKVAWSGFADKWPVAAKVIEKIKFTNEAQAPLIKKVDVEKQKLQKPLQSSGSTKIKRPGSLG